MDLLSACFTLCLPRREVVSLSLLSVLAFAGFSPLIFRRFLREIYHVKRLFTVHPFVVVASPSLQQFSWDHRPLHFPTRLGECRSLPAKLSCGPSRDSHRYSDVTSKVISVLSRIKWKANRVGRSLLLWRCAPITASGLPSTLPVVRIPLSKTFRFV